MMKRYISIILALFLITGIVIPLITFADTDVGVQQTEYPEISTADSSGSEDITTAEAENSYGSENAEENISGPESLDGDTSYSGEEDEKEVDEKGKEGSEEENKADEKEKEESEEENKADEEDKEESEEENEADEEDKEEGEEENEADEEDKEEGEKEDEDVNEKSEEEKEDEHEILYLYITVDDERNVTFISWPEIEYEIENEYGEGDMVILLKPYSSKIEISEDNISFDLPPDWIYEVDIDNHTITITPPVEEINIVKRPEIHVSVDDEHIVTVVTLPKIDYEIIDENGDGNIIIIFNSNDPQIEIGKDDITVNVPLGWNYEIDIDNYTLTIIPFAEEQQSDEFTFEELVEMGAIVIVQSSLLMRSPFERTIIINDVPGLSTWSTLRTAVGGVTANGALPTRIQLTSSFNSNATNAITINNRRQIWLESNVHGVQRTLTQNVGNPWNDTIALADGRRHFIVEQGAQLQIRDIVLDGGNPAFFRGGVHVTGSASGTRSRFVMTEGSEIINCHANHGGAVMVFNGAAAELLGGTIRGNRATPQAAWGGYRATGLGGGVSVDNPSSTLITRNVEIIGNTATWGGAINIHDSASATIERGTIIKENKAASTGGGGAILIWNNSRATMDGGEIVYNEAQEGGGVMLVNTSGTWTDTSSFTLNGGVIAHNTATAQGGGIAGLDIRASYVPGTWYEQAININGGEIYDNSAPVGGGVFVSTGRLNTNGGKIYQNRAPTGGGVYWLGGNWIGTGIDIYENVASQNGGGIAVAGTVSRTLSANLNIYDNVAATGGGGIHIANGTPFNMPSGTIKNNIADDGGGMFIPHTNLNNVTIAQAVVFTENTARNGIKIDNDTARAHISRINPGTVSLFWHGGFVHAFTNYDINVLDRITTTLHQVTYEVGTGEGNISAVISDTGEPVSSGDFVFSGTKIIFTADPDPYQQFENWEVGTKPNADSQFDFTDRGRDTPLTLTINADTHVVGHFSEVLTTLTVSKTVRGALANMNMEFDFTVIFKDSDGEPMDRQFNYTGGIIAGSGVAAPSGGVLALDSTGSTTFMLKHGQVIIIEDIPANSYVQIIETPNINYTVFFIDSNDKDTEVTGNDTNLLAMSEDRVFSFINERNVVPDTGIALDGSGGILLLAGLASLSALAVFALSTVYRRRQNVYIPKRAYR